MTESDRAPAVDSSAGAASEMRDAHYVRITSSGHLRTFVEFALAFLKDYPGRPLVLHTLPASAVPGASVPAPTSAAPSSPLGVHAPASSVPPPPSSSASALKESAGAISGPASAPGKPKLPKARASTAHLPRLLSVAELVKRTYLEKTPGAREGLHQYNMLGTLEDLGVDCGSTTRDGADIEHGADARARELREALAGKRHIRIHKTPYMQITLCTRGISGLAEAGATYQRPLVKRLTKSARARVNRRKRHEEALAMDVSPAV